MIKTIYYALDQKVRIRMKLIFLFSLVTVILESLSIISVFPILKTMIDPNFLKNNVTFVNLDAIKYSSITIIFVTIFLVFLIKNITIFYLSILQSKFMNFAVVDLTGKFYKNYLDLEYKEFVKHNSSYYIRNVIENINNLFSLYFKSVVIISTEVLIVGILLIVLFNLYTLGTVIFLVTFSLISVILYFYNRKQLSKYGTNINTFYYKKLVNLNHGFGSYQEINITKTNEHFIRKFIGNLRGIAELSYKVEAIVQIPRLILEVTGISMILFFLFHLNSDTSQSFNDYLPTLSLFAITGLRMLPSANRIISSFNRIRYSSPAIKVLVDELGRFEKNQKEELKQNHETINFHNKIQIKQLEFFYETKKKKIFENLNLEFKKGEFNVIFGPSGCGKTTLMNILLGFLKPTNGNIVVDDKSILLNLDEWRSLISFVPQEINLADNDLISNLAYGVNDHDIDIKKINNVLEIVDLKKFVDDLPDKLKTYTGEKAFKISGGQKQRIAIARALYRDKEILILDEATSALDGNTEEKIISNIRKNMKKKTIIFISHRESIRKYADKIFEFKDNKILTSK